MRYLITGATGNIGSRVVERLIGLGMRPRVFVRDADRVRARFGDRVEIAIGDLDDPRTLGSALETGDSLLLINSGPRLGLRDEIAARVAATAGVRHLVKLSALSAPAGIAIGAWHARGEAAVRTSGVPFTLVQPAGFMSNALAWAPSIKAHGVVKASTGSGRVAYIHPDDIAAVLVTVLIRGEYLGESLALTGPQALTYAEMTAMIGRAIGRTLAFAAISDEEARQRLSNSRLPPAEADELVSLWRAVREGRLATVSSGVEHVLGHQPAGFERWAAENAAAFAETASRL